MTLNFITKSFGRAAQLACGSVLMLALASCGGGGGSAGTSSNTPSGGTTTPTVTAAGLTVIANPVSINSTSVSPVTITATAVDANNVGLPNVAIQFSTDTGVIATASNNLVTNASGVATATLGLDGNTTPRTISVTATGGGKTAKTSVAVIGTSTQTPSISLLFSSATLPSANATTSAVTVTAQVEDANNNALAGVPVAFTASSGIITVTQGTSGNGGLATATLNNAGSPVNRVITVTATGNGVSTTSTINVTGTTMTTTSAPTSLTLNTLSKFRFNLQDSSGKNIANTPVTFKSAVGNTVVPDSVDAGTTSAPLTDANGNVTFDVTPTVGGADTLTVSADGATANAAFNTTTQSLAVTISDVSTPASPVVVSVSPQPMPEYTSTSCLAVNATYTNGGAGAAGTATVTTSRGQLFTAPTCTAASLYTAASVPFNSSGVFATPLYLSSTTPGLAIVTVAETPGGPTQTAAVTFITQLTSANVPNVSLTASPADVLANTNAANPTAQFSVITATVRDGSAQNNLVQGVPVQFSLSPDPSNGTISPQVAVTQANGQAQTVFYPGPATTKQNGVVVQAQIQGPVQVPAASIPTVDLTVSGSSLFVTLGTGNLITVPSDTTYGQDWSVFVTDSNGNPVSGAVITAQFTALSYSKGYLFFDTALTPSQWTYLQSSLPTDGYNLAGTVSGGPWCQNTDPTDTGVYVPGGPFPIVYPYPSPLDPSTVTKINTPYPFVMPGIPGNVQYSSVNSAGQAVTGANGTITVTILYPQDHALWTNAKLTVTASNVIGTQAQASAVIEPLLSLATALTTASPPPPGATSPYGINQCGVAF